MSNEIISRESVVALPETFGLEQREGAEEPQVVGKVRVVEGPTAGREQFLYMNLKGGAAEVTIKQLRALGWTCNDITALTGLGSVKADMTGQRKPKMAKDADGKYTVHTGEFVTQYNIWPARVRPTMRSEDQKAFASRFKAMAAEAKSSIVQVTDANRAPTELPAASNTPAPAANPASNGVVAETDATALFR
jgi:hypothetical protein